MESRRLDPYNRLQEVLGADLETTLMTLLPPVAAGDLLTKQEPADFQTEIRQRFDRIDARFDQVNKRIDRALLAVIGGLSVVVGVFIGLTVL